MRKVHLPLEARALVLASALLLAASVLPVATSRADVGPPVSVRLLGKPQPAKAGESYTGAVEIVADAAIRVSGFRLEGDGWQPLAVEAPASSQLAKSSRLEVRFSALPRDPSRPLVLAFELGGRTIRQSFDLSEEHYRLMTEGGQVRPVPAGAKRAPLVPAGVVKAGGPETAVAPAPSRTQGEKSYGVVVTGGWYYDHPKAGWTGTDAMTVRVWDQHGFLPDLLATTSTDVNGRFTAAFNWDPSDGYPSISVTFVAQNGRVDVQDHTYNDTYIWATGTWVNYSGTSLEVGDLTSGNESLMPVMNILTIYTRAWRWYNDLGYDVGGEVVFFPVAAPGDSHNSEGVHIVDPWHEGGYCHEYTHHWQTVFAPAPFWDGIYCNNVCDIDPANNVCGHCGWCEEREEVVILEGFPECMSDAIPHALVSLYGLEANGIDDLEPVKVCHETGEYGYPGVTEGYYGALLLDIYDAEQDTHTGYSYFPDALTLGADEILNVIRTYNPSSPLYFLLDLMALYPGINREDLWSTAINCGFNIDTEAPGVVTGLHSDSHTPSVSSPDGTIDLAWNRAPDDAAGVNAYGITVAHSYGLPSAVQDLGNVTHYTTSALAPGTWYFSIRARDRAGNWSGSYAWSGPYIVRDPEPANLEPHLASGWSRPLVARFGNDATLTSVPEPTTLVGDANTTYFNYCGINSGETATSGTLNCAYLLDGVAKMYSLRSIVGAGVVYKTINSGPFTIDGGRHTLEIFHDSQEQIMETDETDNRWAHQWVWSPRWLYADSPDLRDAPPATTAGWDAIVDGSAREYNCSGLYFQGTAYWDAVIAWAADNADDYDCRLHSHSTGAGNGFVEEGLGYSARPAGYLDGVLINGSAVGAATWDVGVLNEGGGDSQFRGTWVPAHALALGDSVVAAVAENEMLLLRRFNVTLPDTGYYTCTVTVDPPSAQWYVNYYTPAFQTGALGQYTARAATTGGVAVLDRHLTQTGWHALGIYRNPVNGAAAVTVTIELQRTPPDFTPYLADGWHAPFVPRPAADGTPSLVALPDTLHGNAASTYLNYCWTNDSPTGWTGSGGVTMTATPHLDGGASLGSVGWSTAAAHQVLKYNQTSARTVRGGRHTLAMLLDVNARIAERSEVNNTSGGQYCWSPYALAFATPVNRSVPPDRTGGWSEITSGEARWYNCDGLRLPAAGDATWRAAAVMSGPDSDVDLRLHDLLAGAKSGFGASQAVSSWGVAESDLVLVNGHAQVGGAPITRAFDLGVTLAQGARGYGAEAVTATVLTTTGADTYGPFDLTANHILHLYELWLAAGQWALRLDNLAGTVNWGLSIYAPDRNYHTKSTAMYQGLACLQGAGQDEWVTVDVRADGWYAIAVWKAGATDLGLAGTYRLRLHSGVTEVPGGAPPAAVTALVAIQPNPFNPQTTIVYDLAVAGPVSLEVFDLRGSRVRTLVAETRPAGRQSAVWNGRDDRGQAAASGVYMARLTAGGARQMKKMVLLK